ncbi:hypothetical protein Kuura_046 [Caulobacter phage Kuura]|nr:hypothetical protein Kuura_046 [Caulobacter phage Kuura]
MTSPLHFDAIKSLRAMTVTLDGGQVGVSVRLGFLKAVLIEHDAVAAVAPVNSDAVAKANAERDMLQAQFNAMAKALEQVTNERNAADAQVNAAIVSLERSAVQNETLELRLNACIADDKRKADIIASKNSKLNDQERHIANQREAIEKLRAQVTGANEDRDTLRAERDRVREELDQWRRGQRAIPSPPPTYTSPFSKPRVEPAPASPFIAQFTVNGPTGTLTVTMDAALPPGEYTVVRRA